MRPKGKKITYLVVNTKLFLSNLAFEGFDGKVDNHVSFKSLFLNEGFKTDVALERSHTGVDQHVPLQIGRQSELTRAHVTLVLFHSLKKKATR